MPFAQTRDAQRVRFRILGIRRAARAAALLAAGVLTACSGSGGGSGGDTAVPACSEGSAQYASTFEGIQQRIFEQHGCTQAVCHGSGGAGARVFELSSHVHKRGKRFWITAPDGSLLYENFTYNDPNVTRFDPPLAFDAADPGERTVR